MGIYIATSVFGIYFLLHNFLLNLKIYKFNR